MCSLLHSVGWWPAPGQIFWTRAYSLMKKEKLNCTFIAFAWCSNTSLRRCRYMHSSWTENQCKYFHEPDFLWIYFSLVKTYSIYIIHMSRYIILLLFMIAGHPDGLLFFWFNYVPSPGTAVIVQCTTAMRRNLVVIPFFIHSNKYYYIIIIVHSYFGNTHCGYRHIYMHTYLGLFPPFFFSLQFTYF